MCIRDLKINIFAHDTPTRKKGSDESSVRIKDLLTLCMSSSDLNHGTKTLTKRITKTAVETLQK